MVVYQSHAVLSVSYKSSITVLLLSFLLVMIITGIISALQCRCLDELSDLLGPGGAEALADLQQLWRLAEGYGFKDWLVFDASVVRGLAYYTGS